MQPSDPVGDHELMYRNVRLGYHTQDDPPKVTSEAFFDPQRRPSVDRAELCGHDPLHTRLGRDGVAQLLAGEVRSIDDVVLHEPLRVYNVDVEPKPIMNDPVYRDNPAHAQIYLKPESNNDKLFRRLRVSLARLANSKPWAIPPGS